MSRIGGLSRLFIVGVILWGIAVFGIAIIIYEVAYAPKSEPFSYHIYDLWYASTRRPVTIPGDTHADAQVRLIFWCATLAWAAPVFGILIIGKTLAWILAGFGMTFDQWKRKRLSDKTEKWRAKTAAKSWRETKRNRRDWRESFRIN